MNSRQVAHIMANGSLIMKVFCLSKAKPFSDDISINPRLNGVSWFP